MIINKYNFDDFELIISDDPCAIFKQYNVESMHGLYLSECELYNNNTEDAYISGLCNYIPNDTGNYEPSDPSFLFINTSRCNGPVGTMRLVMHELMHMSLRKFKWDLDKEEDIITWADTMSEIVYNLIIKFKNKNYAL